MEISMRTILASLTAGSLAAGMAAGAMLLPSLASRADMIDVFASPGETLVAILHAEGSQIYECKPDAAGGLAWRSREPIATLMIDGRTVGRHSAGPTWELSDGSAVTGKASASAPGATVADVPSLRLEVTSRRGSGRLGGVTAIHRLNARGGLVRGPCDQAGAFLAVPYSADYLFYKQTGDAS
jgi:hypothetical protein